MKKTVKKGSAQTLAKQAQKKRTLKGATIRELEKDQLAKAAGGAFSGAMTSYSSCGRLK